MEIIHLILGKANPQRMNGVNKVVCELATKQAEENHPVEVWGITANTVHDYPSRNFKTELFAAQSKKFRLDKKLKQQLFKRRENIVVHLHGGFVPEFYTAAMFLKRNNIPFVITPHGAYNIIAMQKSRLVKKFYFTFFEKKILSAATAIHSLGKSEIDGLQTIYPNNKSFLIPYGFETGGTSPIVELNKKNNFIIGFCGRLDVYTKGLDKLVEAFAKFHAVVPRSELWIIGDSEEKDALVSKVKALNISDAVTFFGKRFGNEKNSLLLQCDVFAHPSRNEGLPASVMEVASMGIPCLVSEATNTGDNIKKYDAGYVVDDVTEEKIYAGLKELFTRICLKDEAALLQHNAVKMIHDAYNWQNILEQFHELYVRVWLQSFRMQIDECISELKSINAAI